MSLSCQMTAHVGMCLVKYAETNLMPEKTEIILQYRKRIKVCLCASSREAQRTSIVSAVMKMLQ